MGRVREGGRVQAVKLAVHSSLLRSLFAFSISLDSANSSKVASISEARGFLFRICEPYSLIKSSKYLTLSGYKTVNTETKIFLIFIFL